MSIKKISAAKAEKVAQSIRESYGVSGEQGPKVSTDYHESGPVIVWEEGPEEWVFNYSNSISAALVTGAWDLFLEPVNHVVLGVYPS